MAMDMSLGRGELRQILTDSAADYAAKKWWAPSFLAYSMNTIEYVSYSMVVVPESENFRTLCKISELIWIRQRLVLF